MIVHEGSALAAHRKTVDEPHAFPVDLNVDVRVFSVSARAPYQSASAVSDVVCRLV